MATPGTTRRALIAFAVGLLSTIGFVASAASGVVTNYSYDASGDLASVSQSCSATGDTYCAGTDACYALSSDPSNCGACGAACPAGPANSYPACVSSSCTFGCNSPYTKCGSACDNLASDVQNCGACGAACAAGPANGYPVCVSSSCTFACNSPYTKCGSGCVNLASDNFNCGGCGIQCALNQACSGGTCISNYFCCTQRQ